MKAGTLSFGLVLAVSALAVSAMYDPSIEVRDLRAELFPNASDFKFDLAGAPASDNGVGAKIQGGSQSRFPALNGLGVSYTLFTIDPCGMNLPHVHPRATELIYVIKGYGLTVGFSEGILSLNPFFAVKHIREMRS
uniref:Cupin type-1 domain-containing protein n=1 Tax=Rhodosorus marinus TaxID=101924 RepID=A0A7S3EC99_9RHOD|mmetsp:Transcript_21472/g.87638  ORF Transcript_21472/g.87638 Transcript_21472/m.87638 type:complete len:136 (+) Transcript_21472:136-543(+)